MEGAVLAEGADVTGGDDFSMHSAAIFIMLEVFQMLHI